MPFVPSCCLLFSHTHTSYSVVLLSVKSLFNNSSTFLRASFTSSSLLDVFAMARRSRNPTVNIPAPQRLPNRSRAAVALSRPCCLRCAKRYRLDGSLEHECDKRLNLRCGYCSGLNKSCLPVSSHSALNFLAPESECWLIYLIGASFVQCSRQ